VESWLITRAPLTPMASVGGGRIATKMSAEERAIGGVMPPASEREA
jgi:hypothetical protein